MIQYFMWLGDLVCFQKFHTNSSALNLNDVLINSYNYLNQIFGDVSTSDVKTPGEMG